MFCTSLNLNLQIHIFYIFLYCPTCHCVSIHIFLPFYSLWFNLDRLYCCVLLSSSFILECLVSCVINPNNCSFQYYIFQFQKSHLFIFPSFSPCLFLCFIKHIGIRVLRSSSANSIISVISVLYLLWAFSSVPFSHSVGSTSLRSHGLQHARLPCPSPTLRTYSNSCSTHFWG